MRSLLRSCAGVGEEAEADRRALTSYRLLLLLAAGLTFVFWGAYRATRPDFFDPLWWRAAFAALPMGMLAGSYASGWVQRHMRVLWRGLIYVFVAWFASLAYLNALAPAYAVGMLFVVTVACFAYSVGLSREDTFAPFLLWCAGVPTGMALSLPAPETGRLVFLMAVWGVVGLGFLVLRHLLAIQASLRHERNRLSTLYQNLPTPVVRVEVEGEAPMVASVNAAFERVFGYDADAVAGQNLQSVVLPEEADARARSRRIRQRVARGEHVEAEVRRATRQGVRDFQLNVFSREAEGGREAYVIYTDITEQKQRERTLRRRTDAMDAAADGIGILDEAGVYEYVNQAHAAVYGYETPEAFRGASWRMCYAEAEVARFEEEVMPQLRAEGEWRGEARGLRQDGSTFPQELSLTLLDDGGIICVVSDITARKEREQELREAKDEAEAASRLKSTMLANMSHELRTPLTSMIGFSELLVEELEGRLERFAQSVHEGGQRLLRTMDSVLHLSELEAESGSIRAEPTRLGPVVAEVVETLSPKAASNEITVHVKEPEPGPVTVPWQEAALVRVVQNLLDNALKFTPAGGRVVVSVQKCEGEALLCVEDTGVGIAEEAQETIFRAFQQESQGPGRSYEGSGLGLTITRRLVDRMEGTIRMESEKGAGTRFVVRLPLHADPAEDAATTNR